MLKRRLSVYIIILGVISSAAAVAREAIPKQEPVGLPVVRNMLHLSKAMIDLFRIDRIAKDEYLPALNDSTSEVIADTTGLLADALNDSTRAMSRIDARLDGFVPLKSDSILQCTANLKLVYSPKVPKTIRATLNGANQMRHGWLQIGGRSFGMSSTIQHTYFGGDALLRRPDPASLDATGLRCSRVMKPKDADEDRFIKDMTCIAEKLSFDPARSPVNQEWIAIFDYNIVTNNCIGASRFIAKCAGGRVTQLSNLLVGAEIEVEQKGKILHRNPEAFRQFEALIRMEERLSTLKDARDAISHLEQTEEALASLIANTRKEPRAKDLIPGLLDLEKRVKNTLRAIQGYDDATTLKAYSDYMKKAFSDFAWPMNTALVQAVPLMYPEAEEATFLDICNRARAECSAQIPSLME